MAQVRTVSRPVFAVTDTIDNMLQAYAQLDADLRQQVLNAIEQSSVNYKRLNPTYSVSVSFDSEEDANAFATLINEAQPGLDISVPSDSRPGTYHTVRVFGRKAVSCSCESFTLGGASQCKHMRRVERGL